MTRRTFLVSLVSLALVGAALAAEPSIEHYLPADAILSLCFYGDNPDIEGTALAQLLKEPEVAEWLTTVRTAIGGANQLLAAAIQVNPALLQPLMGRRVGLALVPVGPRGEAAFLAVGKVGKPGDLAREQLNTFLARLGAMMGEDVRKAQVGGVEVTQFGADPAGLCYAARDDFVLLATARPALERALAANTPKLAGHASFQRMAASAGSPVALLIYDHAAVMERFGADMPQEARAAFAALGLNGVRSAGLRLGAKGRALVGSFFVHTAGERRGLIRALAGAPADLSLLKQAPRDAGLAWVTSLDPTELYDLVVAFLDAMTRRGEPGAGAVVAEFGKRAGLDLRNDVFGSLARGSLITTSGKSLLPALVVSQGLKDGDRFDAAMQKLVVQLDQAIKAEEGGDAGAELRSIRFGPHTIRYLATPGIGVPVAPCYARRGDRVIFALSPIHLKDYLAFLDAGEPSILDAPGYKELAPLVPKDATSVAWSDFGEAFVSAYCVLGPFLSLVHAIPNNPVPIDLANLPAARTVRKHMFGSISYSYATDDVIVAETHSPLGFSAIGPMPAVFLVGVGAGFVLPALADARGAAGNAASMNNMRQITMAMIIHANDQDGALPPNIATLMERKLLGDAKVLVAPHDPAPPQVGGRPCSYVYFLDARPGVKLKVQEFDNPTRIPVLWEREAFQGERRCVAFADGHVEAMDEEEFQDALTRLKEFLKGLKGGEL